MSLQGMIKVLLVDDQAIVAEAMRRMLSAFPDIEVHYCADPAQAIKEAVEFQPTVILLDLVMPEIDGMMLLRFFRANPVTTNIPIIMMFSKEDPLLKSEAFDLGADDYIIKIPNESELAARLRYQTRHMRTPLGEKTPKEEYYSLQPIDQKQHVDSLISKLGWLGPVNALGAVATSFWLIYLAYQAKDPLATFLAFASLFFIYGFGPAPMFAVASSFLYFYFHAVGIWLPILSYAVAAIPLAIFLYIASRVAA